MKKIMLIGLIVGAILVSGCDEFIEENNRIIDTYQTIDEHRIMNVLCCNTNFFGDPSYCKWYTQNPQKELPYSLCVRMGHRIDLTANYVPIDSFKTYQI